MILPKLNILRSHGQQAIPNLNAVTLREPFRGCPRLTAATATSDLDAAAALCPTGAITVSPFSLDLGRCLFCGECALRAPRHIHFTTDYRLASPTREGLIIRPSDTHVHFDTSVIRPELRKLFSNALQLREVSAGGDASVEMELNATGNVNFDFGRYGVGFTASPRHADGVVVSGAISANMAEALQICYDAVAEPKILILCGTDACSGGLFSESRALDRSFVEHHTPDLWMPGAPTHPMTFIDGIQTLLGRKKRD